MTQDRLTNTQRIAAFLLTLDAERSAEILERLEPDEIARIGQEIAAMGKLSQGTKRTVLREFRSLLSAEASRAAGYSLAQQMLEKALDDEQAKAILRNITPASLPSGPPLLGSVTPCRAAELLSNEPVYLIALLLASLSAAQVTPIIACLPAALQPQVRAQLARATKPEPEVRAALERAVRSKASFLEHEEQVDGQAALDDILAVDSSPAVDLTNEQTDSLGPSQRRRLAQTPPAAFPTLDGALSFQGLLGLEQRILQETFERATLRDCVCAISGLDSSDAEQLLARLPLNRRVVIRNRLHGQTPLTLRAITDAQENIVSIARELLTPRKSGRKAAKEASRA
ncbi:MAG: FliG C-terminal domain-containing protein [Armatimonadota bacterium]